MQPTPAKDKFNLDSTYFVAFEMAHEAIERVGHVVVAELDARRQAKEQAAYDLLQEI